MKYFLKAKRYSILNFIYDRKVSTTDRVMIFDNERDILSYFDLALEEDIVGLTQTLESDYKWGYGGLPMLQTAMQISSKAVPFRDLLKNRFAAFKSMFISNRGPTKDRWDTSWYKVGQFKCNPKNYKLFKIVETDIRGKKLKTVQHVSWYQFYNNCIENGIPKEQIVLGGK